jgi:hypothetical protein
MSFKELSALRFSSVSSSMQLAFEFSKTLSKNHSVLVSSENKLYAVFVNDDETVCRITSLGLGLVLNLERCVREYAAADDEDSFEIPQALLEATKECMDANLVDFAFEHLLPNMGKIIYQVDGRMGSSS